MTPLPPGTELQNAHFILGRVLGQGGFGITYEARDTALERTVAIKEFFPPGCSREGQNAVPASPDSAEFAAAREAFIAEARTLAQFAHPHIVAVYLVFQENETAYMVMEFVPGQSLHEIVEERGPLSPPEVRAILGPVCDALAAMHQTGLLHGDIKPGNIMRHENGRIVLLDFGLTRRLEPNRYATMHLGPARYGTAGYAPLEQYGHDAELGPFSDIYALAATLYFLLSGEAPPAATDRAIGSALTLPPTDDAGLNRMIEQGMAMQPAERPQAVGEFLALAKEDGAGAGQYQIDVLRPDGNARWENEEQEDGTPAVQQGEVLQGEVVTGGASYPRRQAGRSARRGATYYERFDRPDGNTVITTSGFPLACCGCGCLAVVCALSIAGAAVGSVFDFLMTLGGGR